MSLTTSMFRFLHCVDKLSSYPPPSALPSLLLPIVIAGHAPLEPNHKAHFVVPHLTIFFYLRSYRSSSVNFCLIVCWRVPNPRGANPLVAERAFPTSDYQGRTGVARCAEEVTGICRDFQ